MAQGIPFNSRIPLGSHWGLTLSGENLGTLSPQIHLHICGVSGWDGTAGRGPAQAGRKGNVWGLLIPSIWLCCMESPPALAVHSGEPDKDGHHSAVPSRCLVGTGDPAGRSGVLPYAQRVLAGTGVPTPRCGDHGRGLPCAHVSWEGTGGLSQGWSARVQQVCPVSRVLGWHRGVCLQVGAHSGGLAPCPKGPETAWGGLSPA